MKKLLTKSLALGRVAVVLLTLVALCVCGATAASRQAARAAEADKDRLEMQSAECLPEPPVTEGEAGDRQMATNGIPNAEPSAWLVAQVAAPGGKDDTRPRRSSFFTRLFDQLDIDRSKTPATASSTAQVSSSLSLQFTLVGAKPSGTS